MPLNKKTVFPIEEFDMRWIERALCWYESRLGKEFISTAKYLVPQKCEFKYLNFNTDDAIQYFVEFICNHLGLDSANIVFTIFMNDDIEISEGLQAENIANEYIQNYLPNENGIYEIGIYSNDLTDFTSTFLQLAYKLTYLKLLLKGVFSFPNGFMIDYAMVIYGFGIFQANAFVRSKQWQGVAFGGWRIKKMGYLNHRIYGYMLANLAKFRREDNPEWKAFLCKDVIKIYDQSRDYLDRKFCEPNADFLPVAVINDEEVFIRKYFYPNGKLSQISHLKDGRLEGLTVFYHSNGELWSERIYKGGIPFSVISNYNSFGDSMKKGTLQDGNGSLFIYNSNGSLNIIENYSAGSKIS